MSRSFIVVWLLVIPLLSQAQAQAQTAEVFKLSHQQNFVGSGIAIVHVVDQLRRNMDVLSAGLPDNEAAATALATTRLQALTPQDQNALRTSAIARVRVAEYGITKTPAIVFDGRATIYGLYDVDRARGIYMNWLRSQKGQP